MYRIVCKTEEEAQRVAAGVHFGIKMIRKDIANVFRQRAWEVWVPRTQIEQDTSGDWIVEIIDDNPDPGEPEVLTIDEAIEQMDEEQED